MKESWKLIKGGTQLKINIIGFSSSLKSKQSVLQYKKIGKLNASTLSLDFFRLSLLSFVTFPGTNIKLQEFKKITFLQKDRINNKFTFLEI